MERSRGLSAEFVHVPSALHGQLFLLAFDPKRNGFGAPDVTRFGFALGAAMLADLYLTGYLVERDGRAVPGKAASPDNPILRAAFAQVGVHNRSTWAQLVVGNGQEAIRAVREQLVTEGWLRVGRYPALATALEPYDPYRVGALAAEVGGALRDAVAGFRAEPWLLAAGLLGVLAELPGLAGVVGDADRHRLQELAREAIAPISGLAEVIRLRSGR